MKLSTAKSNALMILTEYATDPMTAMAKAMTSFGNRHGKANGKKADSIAAGKAKQYKDHTYTTTYEMRLPALGKITQHLKKERPPHAISVQGPALDELLVLFRSRKFKKDADGEYIMPFGDNIRLLKIGNAFMLKYKHVPEKKDVNFDIEKGEQDNDAV